MYDTKDSDKYATPQMLMVILADRCPWCQLQNGGNALVHSFMNTSFGGLTFLLIQENSLACGGPCEAPLKHYVALT